MNFTLAFIFSFLAVIGYAVISIYIGKVAQKYGAFWTSFWIQILGLPLTLIFIPFLGLHISMDPYVWLVVIFGIGTFITFILYSKSLSIGPVSIVQSVLKLSSLITFILAILFLGESINTSKIIGAILLIAGMILVSLNFKELFQKKLRTTTKALPLSFLQAVINAVIAIFLAIAIKHFDAFSANVEIRIIIVVLFLLFAVGRPKPQSNFLKTSWKILFFIAVIDVLVFILFTSAIQLYEVSFASMTRSAIPVFTAIIAAMFFKERLTKIEKIGIILTVIGSIFSGIGG